MTDPVVRIGSRKSLLAMWQANHVAALLEHQGMRPEVVGIDTRGDKVLDVSIAKIGSKGVFTEELEELLASGEIDIAVHSAKDLQSTLPEDFSIAAFTEREEVHDVIVSDHPVDLDKPLRLGTSSTRRQAMFRKYFPQVHTVPVRGNLQTRLTKMRNGDSDALALAYAGVHRMGYGDLVKANLDVNQFVPAVGQGSLAIEVHSSLSRAKLEMIRKVLNHPPTERQLLAERAFLRKLDGGCSIPAFGLARENDGLLSLTGGVISLDGKEIVRETFSDADPETLGLKTAEYVLSNGGDSILEEIRKSL